MPAVADDPMADIVAGDAAAARPEPTDLVGGAAEPAELTGGDTQPLQSTQTAPHGLGDAAGTPATATSVLDNAPGTGGEWVDETATPSTVIPPMPAAFQQYLANPPPARNVH